MYERILRLALWVGMILSWYLVISNTRISGSFRWAAVGVVFITILAVIGLVLLSTGDCG